MINNFQEYTKAVNQIEDNKIKEIRKLREQLFQVIINKDKSISLDDIVYLRVDVDCMVGELSLRKKINLKSMEEELHILVYRENRLNGIFYDNDKKDSFVQYVYYFDIYL